MDAQESMMAALELVRGLIDTRTFKKERLEDADVREALAVLARHAAGGDPSARLDAIALLGKAGEVSVPIAKAVRPPLRAALANPLPPLQEWGAAEDRFYLAKAVAVSEAAWIPGYAADALGRAEINEKLSRDEWAKLAIDRADDLSGALAVVGRSATDWLSSREDRTEAAYRKLARICEALTQVLLTADVPSGQDFGKAIVGLVRIAGGGQGSEILRLREEAAIGVLDLVIQLLRLNFDVLLDSDIYRAVGAVRGWWRPARAPDAVERKADRIARLAMRGLQLLARQGVRDNELRRAVAAALDPSRTDAVGKAIATSDPSLDPGDAIWLASGRAASETRNNESVRALSMQAEDEILGRLLLALDHHELEPVTLASVADAIEVFEPTQSDVVRKAGDRMMLVRQWAEGLARKRRLSTYAARGEIVQYDPTVHDTSQVLQRNGSARVISPGVLRSVDGRPSVIVTKAVVEAL